VAVTCAPAPKTLASNDAVKKTSFIAVLLGVCGQYTAKLR
jgi:hypothetical protein